MRLVRFRFRFPSRSQGREEDRDDQRRSGERRNTVGGSRSGRGANRLLRFAGQLAPEQTNKTN